MDDAKKQEIVDLLNTSYNMELETVCNYLTISQYLDGFRAKHVKDSLATDVQEELGHAQQLASRIKVLDGTPLGSQALKMTQKTLQPPDSPLDVIDVCKGVIDAEKGAIEQYQKIIEVTDGIDFVTQDMCIALQADEQEHLRLFRGFLSELEAGLV